jgi:hypothetical protein
MALLTQAIENATYNEAAERKRAEDQANADKERTEFRRYLNEMAVRIQEGVNKETVSAESGKWALDEIQKAQDFLAKHPNADQRALTQRSDEVTFKIKNIEESQSPIKRAFRIINELPKEIEEMLAKEIIPSTNRRPALKIVDDLKVWVSQNNYATKGEWELKLNTTQAELDAWIPSGQKRQELENQQKIEEESFRWKRLFASIFETAGKVIGTLFYIMLCLVAGSLAANDAIGRDRMYRVFYFIWGFLFAPFVLIYYLFRWFKGTSPYLYKLLPVTTTLAETSLGKFFTYPFYYIEDENARKKTEEFLSSLAEAIGTTAEGTTENSGSTIKKLKVLAQLFPSSS